MSSRESTGLGFFETPVDGSSLGSAGMSANTLEVIKARQQEPNAHGLLLTHAELAEEKNHRQLMADSTVSFKIEEALEKGIPADLIAAVEWYREIAGHFADECLNDWALRHRACIGHGMATIRLRAVRAARRALQARGRLPRVYALRPRRVRARGQMRPRADAGAHGP